MADLTGTSGDNIADDQSRTGGQDEQMNNEAAATTRASSHVSGELRVRETRNFSTLVYSCIKCVI